VLLARHRVRIEERRIVDIRRVAVPVFGTSWRLRGRAGFRVDEKSAPIANDILVGPGIVDMSIAHVADVGQRIAHHEGRLVKEEEVDRADQCAANPPPLVSRA